MEPILYKVLRPLIKGFVKVVYRPTYVGLENIPKEGRVVLAGNHTSNLDCVLLISSTKRCVHFLAKDSLAKGILKPLFLGMGIIPVNRKSHDPSVLRTSENVLNNEQVIGIFPEGTINRTDDVVMPFKKGAVKMARNTESPIVPFCISGKYKPFKKSIKITFEKPIMVKEELVKANEILMKIVSDDIIKNRED